MLIPQELQLSQKWDIDSGANRDCQFSQRNIFSESIEQMYLKKPPSQYKRMLLLIKTAESRYKNIFFILYSLIGQ